MSYDPAEHLKLLQRFLPKDPPEFAERLAPIATKIAAVIDEARLTDEEAAILLIVQALASFADVMNTTEYDSDGRRAYFGIVASYYAGRFWPYETSDAE